MKMAGDGELAAFLQGWPARRLAQASDLKALRAVSEEESRDIPLPPGTQVRSIAHSDVTGELVLPAKIERDGAILFHHGGGHVFGSPAEHRHLAARIATATGLRVYNMAYPLAPEMPYPCGLDQALVNYRFVLTQGVSPEQLIVAGDSAGGNLTVAMTLRALAEGLPTAGGVYLISPWLDLDAIPSNHDASRDPLLDPAIMRAWSACYRGHHAASDPAISPINASIDRFPPTLIQAGGAELLLNDSINFGRKLAQAGHDIQLSVAKDMVHAWPLFHADLPTASAAAFSELANWLERKWPKQGNRSGSVRNPVPLELGDIDLHR